MRDRNPGFGGDEWLLLLVVLGYGGYAISQLLWIVLLVALALWLLGLLLQERRGRRALVPLVAVR